MTLAEASALIGESMLRAEAYDPVADREALETLAAGCGRFSPVVGLEDAERPECLLLDVGAVGHLFGGEAVLVQRIVDDFRRRKLRVHVAVADTLGAAWAVARGFSGPDGVPLLARWASSALTDRTASGEAVAHEKLLDGLEPLVRDPFSHWAIVPSGKTVEALAALPIDALRLPPEAVALLGGLGIHEIGQLMALPRDALASRFGADVLRRLNQAQGQTEEPIKTYRPPAAAAAEHVFDYPTAHRAALETNLRRLVEQLTDELARQQQGVTHLRCEFTLERGLSRFSRSENGTVPLSISRVEVSLYQASVSVKDLFELTWMQVEKRLFSSPVATIRLEAVGTAPLEYRQQELFARTPHEDVRRLGRLISRLTARLGRTAVLGVRLVADAQPELAYRYRPLVDRRRDRRRRAGVMPAGCLAIPARSRRAGIAMPGATAGRSSQSLLGKPAVAHPRPLLLSARPIPLRLTSSGAGGSPLRFQEHGRSHRVTAAWGPERIETGWWRGRSIGRDYYRVETSQGRRLWLFRRLGDGKWFLHGRFQ